jgi:DNA-binding Lrp family transcriptional regulator
MEEYAQKFRQLDSLDFKIIKSMYRYGFSNISKIAELIDVPKQTASYHSRKLDQQDLVRFRALIDEPKLGLKSFVVMAPTSLSGERISSLAMTCFPLWRYLAVVDGWKHGDFVRYAIPPDKERDLEAFLNEVKRRSLILDFEIFPTTSSDYPLLNLDFYTQKEGFPVFDWDKWTNDFDGFPEVELVEPSSYEKAKIDLYDLAILRCLEINARTNQRKIVKEMAKILKEKEVAKLIPLVSRRMRDTIMQKGLVRGYRAYVFPNPVPTTMLLMYHLTFSNSSGLRKFVAGLNHLPFNTGYEKVLERDELFVRMIVPTHEGSNAWKSMAMLAEKGYLKDAHLFLGDLAHKTWDNVEIYQMFKGEAWNFSYGIAAGMLDRTLSKK